jgi:hypothetical protein
MQTSGTTQVTSCLPTPRSSLSILVSPKQLLPSTRDKTAVSYSRSCWRGSNSAKVVPYLESMSPGFTAKLKRTISDIWTPTGQPLNDTRRPDSSTSSRRNSSVQIFASPQNDAHPTQPHVTLPRHPIHLRHTSTLPKAPSQPLPLTSHRRLGPAATVRASEFVNICSATPPSSLALAAPAPSGGVMPA